MYNGRSFNGFEKSGLKFLPLNDHEHFVVYSSSLTALSLFSGLICKVHTTFVNQNAKKPVYIPKP